MNDHCLVESSWKFLLMGPMFGTVVSREFGSECRIVFAEMELEHARWPVLVGRGEAEAEFL